MRSAISVGVLIGLLPALAQAKCVTDTYTIGGRVLDAAGAGVAGASIEVKWRDYSSEQRSHVLSASDGTFIARILVNRFSSGGGMARMYNCDFVLAEAAIEGTSGQTKLSPAKVRFNDQAANVELYLQRK